MLAEYNIYHPEKFTISVYQSFPRYHSFVSKMLKLKVINEQAQFFLKQMKRVMFYKEIPDNIQL